MEYDAHQLFENIEEDLKENNFQHWNVDDEGNITCKTRVGMYEITGDKLLSQNWLTHMFSKAIGKETNMIVEFYHAYLLALKKKGIKSITIDIENPHILIN